MKKTFIKREIKNLCTLTLREVGVAKFTITLDKRDFVAGRGFEPLKLLSWSCLAILNEPTSAHPANATRQMSTEPVAILW